MPKKAITNEQLASPKKPQPPGFAKSATRPSSPPKMAPKITVILAEDHTVVREGLRLLLASAPDMVVVGEVDNGRRAVQMVEKLRPDVVVLDVMMPTLNGLEATRQIMKF